MSWACGFLDKGQASRQLSLPVVFASRTAYLGNIRVISFPGPSGLPTAPDRETPSPACWLVPASTSVGYERSLLTALPAGVKAGCASLFHSLSDPRGFLLYSLPLPQPKVYKISWETIIFQSISSVH